MTVEQIELRKILTQMLADNGINRETLKDLVKEIIEEKVDKSINTIIAQTSTIGIDKAIKNKIDQYIDNEIANVVKVVIRERVNNIFSRIAFDVNVVDARTNFSEK